LAHHSRRALIAAYGMVGAALILSKYQTPPPALASEQIDMHPLSDIVPAKPPTALPPARFTTLEGAAKTLADYEGRPVVLNFWATWCAPCVAELPELDKLAATGTVTVLAVSADRKGALIVRPFAATHHIDHATLLLDPGSDAVGALRITGFPTTLIIGADGKLRGTLEGPANWSQAGPAISALLR
jgi:thiol-disulfide isomerase/thioredoxin